MDTWPVLPPKAPLPTSTKSLSSASSLNPPSCDLSSVQTDERWCDSILVFASLDFYVSCCEDNLDVARVSLVGVDTTMRTVCATAGFLQCKTVKL